MYTLLCCFLVIGIICIISIVIIAYKYAKTIKDIYKSPEDKTGLYDYIEIDNNLINIDAIVYINYKYSIQEKTFILNIILNNGEKLFFKFDIPEEGYNVYQEIIRYLDPAIITID